MPATTPAFGPMRTSTPARPARSITSFPTWNASAAANRPSCSSLPSQASRASPTRADRDELYAEWEARWGQEVTVERTNPEYLEFFHRDASKGNALAAVAAHYGIRQEETMAFGDSYNDISMLEWAGCGVAVANAKPTVQAAAKWVSPLTNEESAVADALARLT